MQQPNKSDYFSFHDLVKAVSTQQLETVIAEAVGRLIGGDAKCSVSSIKLEYNPIANPVALVSLTLRPPPLDDTLPF